MLLPRLTSTLAVLAVTAAATSTGAAAKTPTRTLKVTGGTTALTLDPQAVANLQAANVTMSGTAPGTTAGTLLTYPVKSGSLKVKGKKVVSGAFTHSGGLEMRRDPVTLGLTNLAVKLGAKPVLNAKLTTLAVELATLKVPASKVKITKKTVTLKVTARLTGLAASAMNGAFAIDSFKANDPIGTATIKLTVKAK